MSSGRPEDRHGQAQLGQQAEALDELGLDPHDPPRVGVDPVGRAAAVQQPLICGRRRDLAAAQRDRALTALAPV
jgi:hypothetical protein